MHVRSHRFFALSIRMLRTGKEHKMRNLYIKAGSVAAAAAIVVTAIATNHTATSARTAPASKAAAAKSSAGLPVLKLAYNVGINNWNTTLDPANTAFTNDA